MFEVKAALKTWETSLLGMGSLPVAPYQITANFP